MTSINQDNKMTASPAGSAVRFYFMVLPKVLPNIPKFPENVKLDKGRVSLHIE